MEAISYGKEKPADAGHDEAAWAKNRRATFNYLAGGGRCEALPAVPAISLQLLLRRKVPLVFRELDGAQVAHLDPSLLCPHPVSCS
jgi:hypothetical protein